MKCCNFHSYSLGFPVIIRMINCINFTFSYMKIGTCHCFHHSNRGSTQLLEDRGIMGGIIRVFSSQLPDHMPTFIYSFCESILSFIGCGNWSGYSCLVYFQHKTTVPLWMKIHQAMKLMPTTTGQS